MIGAEYQATPPHHSSHNRAKKHLEHLSVHTQTVFRMFVALTVFLSRLRRTVYDVDHRGSLHVDRLGNNPIFQPLNCDERLPLRRVTIRRT